MFSASMYFKFILAILGKNGEFDRRKSTKYDYKTIFNRNLDFVLEFNRKIIRKTISIVLFVINHQ